MSSRGAAIHSSIRFVFYEKGVVVLLFGLTEYTTGGPVPSGGMIYL